jgi:hypothetical protein
MMIGGYGGRILRAIEVRDTPPRPHFAPEKLREGGVQGESLPSLIYVRRLRPGRSLDFPAFWAFAAT